MATLPSLGSTSDVNVLITTVEDPAGIDATKAGLAEVGAAAGAASATGTSALTSFSSKLNAVGTQMVNLGRTMTTYVTLPIVGIGVVAAKAASDFQQNMTLIQTQAGDTTDNIQQLSDQVMALSENGSKFNANQLATGLYHIVSLGLRGKDAIDALNASQQLAAVGNSNLEDTTNAVAVAWKSGIDGAQNFGNAAASLNAIVGAGNMRMSDLVQALGPTGLLAAAKTAGLSLNDVGSAEAQLADMTGNAQESATHLRMLLMQMVAPSAAAQKSLDSIGISSGQLGIDLQEGGLPKAVSDLRQHLTDTFGPTALTSLNTYFSILQNQGPDAADAFANASQGAADVVSKAFGGARSGSAALQLISGFDGLMQKEDQVKQSNKNFAADVVATQHTAAYKMSSDWSKMYDDMVKLGSAALPSIVNIFNAITNAVNGLTTWFSHLNSGQKQAVLDILAAFAVGGPVLLALGTVAKAISNIITLSSQALSGVQSLTAFVGGPVALAAWAAFGAAAVAAFILIQNAANQTKQVIDNMQKGINSDYNSINSATSQLQDLAKNGTPAQQARAKAILANPNYLPSGNTSGGGNFLSSLFGFASGTNYAPGGWSVVGENGPEMMYVPQGSQILSNGQSGLTGNSHSTSITIGTVVLPNVQNARTFIQELNQDVLNIGKGLTTNQGARA